MSVGVSKINHTSKMLIKSLCNPKTGVVFSYSVFATIMAMPHIWRKLDIDGVLQKDHHNTKISYLLSETVFLMALQHQLEARNKRSRTVEPYCSQTAELDNHNLMVQTERDIMPPVRNRRRINDIRLMGIYQVFIFKSATYSN